MELGLSKEEQEEARKWIIEKCGIDDYKSIVKKFGIELEEKKNVLRHK